MRAMVVGGHVGLPLPPSPYLRRRSGANWPVDRRRPSETAFDLTDDTDRPSTAAMSFRLLTEYMVRSRWMSVSVQWPSGRGVLSTTFLRYLCAVETETT